MNWKYVAVACLLISLLGWASRVPVMNAVGIAFSPATACETAYRDAITIGASGVFSAWSQLVTSTSAARNQLSWSFSMPTSTNDSQVEAQLGLGGAGSEVVIGDLTNSGGPSSSGSVSHYSIFDVASSSRLAVRTRNRTNADTPLAAFAINLCR